MLTALIIGFLFAGGVVFLVGMWWISTYNYMHTLLEAAETMMANLQTEYQRRVDVFVNMGNTVKSFKNHEKETFVELSKARNPNYFPTELKSKIEKFNMLESFFSRLMVQTEKYPELKADGLHHELMDEIRDTEVRVNAARVGWNEVAREVNTIIRSFPTNFVARIHNIAKLAYPTWAVDPKPNQAAPIIQL